MYNTFINVDELCDRTLSVIVIDTRFYLSDTERGWREYLDSHIPGAIYANLDKDLSGPITDKSGRHPLPSLSNFKDWLSRNGLARKQIVVYDSSNGGIASRLWFMLQQLGYKSVAVLIGGFEEWKSRGCILSSGKEKLAQITVEIEAELWDDGPYRLYSSSDVYQLINTGRIVDSRSQERFSGSSEPIDKIAGRIPGAINRFWKNNFQEDNLLKSREELMKLFNFTQTDKVYHCGSGVTACLNLVVAEYLGLPKPALYTGSWSEWINHYPEEIQRN